MAIFYTRIADFIDKLCGFADLKSTVHRGSAEKFGPDSGLCMSGSSDYGLDHSFLVGLWFRYFCVLSTIFVNFKSYSTERGIALFQKYNQIFRFFQTFRQKWAEVLRKLVHFTFPSPPPSAMLGFVRHKLLVAGA